MDVKSGGIWGYETLWIYGFPAYNLRAIYESMCGSENMRDANTSSLKGRYVNWKELYTRRR